MDLTTTRLRLRAISLTEARRVVAGVPGLDSAWAPGYPTAGDIVAMGGYLELRAVAGDPAPFGHYQIQLGGLTIGTCGFHGPPGDERQVEIGYGVVPAERGNGYATEAVRALLEVARANGVTTVRGKADRANEASQRVMVAAGMAFVDEDDRHRHFLVRLDRAP
jgi:RimJ/RimL family protein N-acetyltransferase